jgi:hypothetical protein
MAHKKSRFREWQSIESSIVGVLLMLDEGKDGAPATSA